MSQILRETRPAIEAALAGAERELEEINQRRQELEDLIARARIALQAFEPEHPITVAEPREHRTLHDAMRLILEEHDNRPMKPHDLARQINARGLYEKRDRTPVDPSQIQARARKYATRLFERGPDGIRLKIPARSEQ